MADQRESQGRASFANDLRFVVGVLWNNAWLIAICTALAAGLGLIYLRVTPKTFAAKTVIQVEQEDQKVVKFDGIRSEDRKSIEVLKTYEQNITSPEVLLRVIHHPTLADAPGFLAEVAPPRTDNRLQEALARHIEAKIRRGTRLIDIVVQDRDPALAQRVAALVAEEFGRWNFEAQRETGRLASRFLLEEAERLKAQLKKSEQALQAYKEQHETVSLTEKNNLSLTSLDQFNQRLTAAKAERLKVEADCAQLTNASVQSTTELLVIPGIANSPQIVEARRSIADKEAQLATLTQRYKSAHPKFIAAKTELAELKSGLNQAILKAADVLTSQYQAAVLNERKLEEALAAQQKTALEFDKLGSASTALARDVESDRALYDSVLTRLKETDITKDLGQDALRIVARPLLPDRPVKPSKTIVLGLSLIAGFLAGCGLAFARHAADPSLRTLQDAETRLGLRVLGEIPRLPAAKRHALPAPVLLGSDFAAAESFRTLRTSLSLIGNHAERKSFLFTSAQAGEGKTFCAINCAVSFAQLGLRTLLVDADFRMPQLARFFFPDAGSSREGGGADAAGGWERHARPTHVPNLSILDGNAGAGDLSGSQRFDQFIEEAVRRYDRVVLDSAPIQLVSDTLLFARHVQAVCLVIHAGRTPADEVRRAALRLTEAGAPLVGFVWNQVKEPPDYGAYYGRTPGAREVHAQEPRLLAVIEAIPQGGVSKSNSGGDPPSPARGT